MNELEKAFTRITNGNGYDWFVKRDKDIETIKQALATPSSEEICEMLNEYSDVGWIYKGNYFYSILGSIKVINNEINLGELSFPPHILVKIARFYEVLGE